MSKTSDALKILDSAKALIEKGWHQGYYARDEHGERRTSSSKHAVAFCAVGALERAGNDMPLVSEAIAKQAVRHVVPGGDIVGFNDAPGRTKAEVMEVFEAAKGWVKDDSR